MAGMLGDVIGGIIGGVGASQAGEDLAAIGTQGKTDLLAVGDEARADTKFVGNTVTSNTGNTTIDAAGGVTSILNQPQQDVSDNALSAANGIYGSVGDGSMSLEQQSMSDAAMSAAQGLYGEAGVSVADRTNDIFSNYQAAAQPGINRANAQQGNDLYASGRTGFGGGSSEQYALKSAQEDQMMQAFFGARSQAGQEQANQANAANALNQGSTLQGSFNTAQLGAQANAANAFNQGSILQDAHMGNQANLGLTGANYAQTGQIAGANLGSQTDIAAIQTELDGARSQAEINAGMFKTGSDLASGFVSAGATGYGQEGADGGVGGAVKGVLDWLF
jgi:hypothetical protein